MVFDNIDRIIENVVREELILEGTHVSDYRKRALNTLLSKGFDEPQAKEYEDWFFTNHFHGMKNNIIRLEEFFMSAFADVWYDDDKVNRLIDILGLIKRNWQKDGFYNISQLTRNNASTYEQLNGLFGDMVDDEKKNDEALASSQDGASMAEGYSVVNVKTYKEAHEIGKYSCPNSKLCFATSKGTWDSYTSSGANECYVILRDGWKKMKAKDYLDSPNRPFDEYGLSMIFLFIKSNGEIRTSNTRWNHETGDNYKGDVDQSFTKGDIAKLLGVNFNEVFKPNDKFEKKLKIATRRLANGIHPNTVFDFCGSFSDGLAKVELCGRHNFVTENFEIAFPNLWFDNAYYFNEGLAAVKINGKWSYINPNGEFPFHNKWFDYATSFYKGVAIVKLGNKYSYIGNDGEMLFKDKWFDECFDFQEGFGMVIIDDKVNFIDKNGDILSPSQWFDACSDFARGFARVMIGKQWNHIKPNGELVSPNQWYASTGNFNEGFAVVKVGERYNYINDNGDIIYKPNEPNKWFYWCYDFKDGLGKVEGDGKYNFLKPNGELVSPSLWFDDCGCFDDGYCKVKVKRKCNLVNLNGEFVSTKWFDDCGYFNEGFAMVELKGKCNFINENGELLSDQWFEDCRNFKDGVALVELNDKMCYIDKNGRLYDEMPKVTESRMMSKIISENIRRSLRRLI